MNPFFLTQEQRETLRAKNPSEFNEILKHYKTDLASGTYSLLSENDWQKAYRWAGEKWFENSKDVSLTIAWQRVSEEFHRSFRKTLIERNSLIPNPITHAAFLEDFEVKNLEVKKQNKLGTKMIIQVFIGLVLWKILIIYVFQTYFSGNN